MAIEYRYVHITNERTSEQKGKGMIFQLAAAQPDTQHEGERRRAREGVSEIERMAMVASSKYVGKHAPMAQGGKRKVVRAIYTHI